MSSNKVDDAITQHFNRYGGRATLPKEDEEKIPFVTGLQLMDQLNEKAISLGDLVEISGASSVGKTRLLHVITAKILANVDPDSNEKGKPKICWYDLNGGLDIRLLRSMVLKPPDINQDASSSSPNHDPLDSLLVYYPKSSLAMCASLHSLPKFLQTDEGSSIKAIIIDALGMFHYVDRHRREREVDKARETRTDSSSGYPQNEDYLLIKILRELLSLRRLTVFVTKCALYEEEKLSVSWPFPNAGIPSAPADFMPSAWLSIVTHSLVLYRSQKENEDEEESNQRAILVLNHMDGHRRLRQPVVTAATSLTLATNPAISEGEIFRV